MLASNSHCTWQVEKLCLPTAEALCKATLVPEWPILSYESLPSNNRIRLQREEHRRHADTGSSNGSLGASSCDCGDSLLPAES